MKHLYLALLLLPLNILAQTFTKITSGNIVNDGESSVGINWADYDNDGFPDLYVCNESQQDNYLYKNNGDGTFTKISDLNIVKDSSTNRACWVDYDNDGDLDVFLGLNNENSNNNNWFFINNGNSTFTKVTSGIIVSDGGWSNVPSWGDYDNDGFADLFVSNWNGENNFLYKNNGDGTFTKITNGPVVNDGGNSTGGIWGDYDNDGFIDLFVANFDENNFLYKNNGDGTFTKITNSPIISDGGKSYAGNWFDYDNDGDLDLFVPNGGTQGINENDFLYENNGDGSFTKMTSGPVVTEGKEGISSATGDFDNDGDLDLYVVNTSLQNNLLYLNDGSGNFTQITTGDIVNDGMRTNAVACADFNRDGFLDIAAANRLQNNLLFQNDGNSNHWTNIKLIGIVSNRSAIGAKVKVKATINTTPGWQYREVASTTGNRGQDDLNVEFGFADATNIDSLIIEWPSGIVCTYTDLLVDSFMTFTENCCDSADFEFTTEGLTAQFTVTSPQEAVSYWWDFGDSNYSSLKDPEHTFSKSGTYNVCLAVNALCGIDTVCKTITICSPFIDSANAVICQGDSILLKGAYQTSSGTYIDTFASANGCDSVLVTQLTVTPVISDSLSTSICQGDSLFIAGAYQTTSGTYIDTFTSSSGCDSIMVSHLTVRDSSNSLSVLRGFVFYKGSLVTAGQVRLISKSLNSPQSMVDVDSVAINPDGSFEFLNVPKGNYLIKAQGDTALYPDAVPTYADSTNHWQKAMDFNFSGGCPDTLDNIEIRLIDFPTTIGFGGINGKVKKGGRSAGNLISGIGMTLELYPNNMIKGFDLTDEEGNFNFSNIEAGIYRIYADIPGYEMDTLQLISFSDVPKSYNVDVCIRDDYKLEVCAMTTAIPEYTSENFDIKLYPNPANKIAFVELPKHLTQAVLKIFNNIGEEIYQKALSGSDIFSGRISLDVGNMPAGLYYIRVENGNGRQGLSKLIVE